MIAVKTHKLSQASKTLLQESYVTKSLGQGFRDAWGLANEKLENRGKEIPSILFKMKAADFLGLTVVQMDALIAKEASDEMAAFRGNAANEDEQDGESDEGEELDEGEEEQDKTVKRAGMTDMLITSPEVLNKVVQFHKDNIWVRRDIGYGNVSWPSVRCNVIVNMITRSHIMTIYGYMRNCLW